MPLPASVFVLGVKVELIPLPWPSLLPERQADSFDMIVAQIDELNRLLCEMRADGTYQRIHEKWFGEALRSNHEVCSAVFRALS